MHRSLKKKNVVDLSTGVCYNPSGVGRSEMSGVEVAMIGSLRTCSLMKTDTQLRSLL